MIEDKIYIYGKHALEEALMNAPKAVKKVFLASNVNDINLDNLILKAGITKSKLGSGLSGGVTDSAIHQGVIGLVSLSGIIQPYKKFVDNLKVSPDTSLILLDELQDPHNVGAVIRSAAAFGVSGILIPEHNQVGITGAVVKVSAGMAFRIPLITIGNVNNTIRDLKDRGFWVYGLDGEAKQTLNEEKFDAPALFILGNEAVGIRMKTKEICDILISIPMSPNCESLNVAASAAVALYGWSVKHPKAISPFKNLYEKSK